MAKAHLEILAGCVRLWQDDSSGWGDPYDWSATIRGLPDGGIEIIGVDRPVTPSMFRALRTMFNASGIHAVTYRRADGRVKELFS